MRLCLSTKRLEEEEPIFPSLDCRTALAIYYGNHVSLDGLAYQCRLSVLALLLVLDRYEANNPAEVERIKALIATSPFRIQ